MSCGSSVIVSHPPKQAVCEYRQSCHSPEYFSHAFSAPVALSSSYVKKPAPLSCFSNAFPIFGSFESPPILSSPVKCSTWNNAYKKSRHATDFFLNLIKDQSFRKALRRTYCPQAWAFCSPFRKRSS